MRWFFQLYLYFFSPLLLPLIYMYIRCYRVTTAVYIFIYTHTHTRAINLFKCYSEIISEHDRALRIYTVYTHTFKHILYIYLREFKFAASSRFLDLSFSAYIHVIPPPLTSAHLTLLNVPQMVSNTHASERPGMAARYIIMLIQGFPGRAYTQCMCTDRVRARCMYDSRRGRNP